MYLSLSLSLTLLYKFLRTILSILSSVTIHMLQTEWMRRQQDIQHPTTMLKKISRVVASEAGLIVKLQTQSKQRKKNLSENAAAELTKQDCKCVYTREKNWSKN